MTHFATCLVTREMQHKVNVHALFYRLTKQNLIDVEFSPPFATILVYEFNGHTIAIPYEALELAIRLGVLC